MNIDGEYTLDDVLEMFPSEPNRKCALHLLPSALDFVRERDTEFGTAQMQKHLKSGYNQTVKVIDALIALCVIEIVEEKPRKYKRLCEKDEINHDIYYNGWMRDADTEYSLGWDPSLFRTREEALNYAKAAYGKDCENPVLVVEKIQVGNGWDSIEKEEIGAN
jgi:hypothetical protein